MNDALLVGARQRALSVLAGLDARLAAVTGSPLTLNPERTHPTTLRVLGETLLSSEDDPHVIGAFAQTMETIVEAQLHNFPENIFWDFDYMAARLLADGQRWPQGVVDYLRKTSLLMARLQHTFGCHSAIRFRYVHDFVYGFDWARWAALDPVHRERIGPYDMRFLRYVLQRGEQIVRLASEDTSRYPAMGGAQWRNVFVFRRDPEAESLLLRDLAQRSMIPVMAWRTDAPVVDPRIEYSAFRTERARELGLTQP